MRRHEMAATLITIALVFIWLCGCERDASVIEIEPIGSRGTISFVMSIDREYWNGFHDSLVEQTLWSLPGLGQCTFRRSYEDIRVQFKWDSAIAHSGFQLTPSELPGPADYTIAFTWDSERAVSEGYFQGVPFGTEAAENYTPWQVPIVATQVVLGNGPVAVQGVRVTSEYTPPSGIREFTGDGAGSGSQVLWQPDPAGTLGESIGRGRLLYSTNSLGEAPFDSWIMEGPGIIDYDSDGMSARSQIPNPSDGSTGHFNFWCPVELPEDFIAEWEFRPVSEYGLAGVFFAARGEDGEDLFDLGLQERDGHYRQYHSSDIDCYFLFFYTNRMVNRTTDYSTSWLLKSNTVSNLVKGLIGVEPRNYDYSRVRLIKQGGRIEFSVNGRITLDFEDPGSERWGPVLGGGKIGFRQMARTVAAYRSFNVWSLRR